jgi:hypothetical protein
LFSIISFDIPSKFKSKATRNLICSIHAKYAVNLDHNYAQLE